MFEISSLSTCTIPVLSTPFADSNLFRQAKMAWSICQVRLYAFGETPEALAVFVVKIAVAKKHIFEIQSVHINVNCNNWNCVKLTFLKHARLSVKMINALLINVIVELPKLVFLHQFKC